MKLHALSNPNRPTSPDYDKADPFAIIIHNYIKNLSPKYDIVHYGVEGAVVDCTHYNVSGDLATFNRQAGEFIRDLKSPDDIILAFYGTDVRDAANMNPELKVIEPVIGYDANGVFATYKVFESYSHMHYYYGVKGQMLTPSWFDAVIPSGKNPGDFEFKLTKQNYALVLGRVIENKGIHVAIQATKEAGIDLVIAGPGDLKGLGYSNLPSHVTYVGVANKEQRKELLSNAKVLIGATYYLEPFGNMVIEAYFSGTPVITTDWGAFTETVIPGVTGFRCREFREFTEALNNIDSISGQTCYDFAMKNYSFDIVYDKHDKYLQKVIANNYYRK